MSQRISTTHLKLLRVPPATMASDLASEDQWTYVTSKKRRNIRKKPTAPKQPLHGGRVSAHLTVSEIKENHRRVERQWVESACCRNLKQLMLSKRYSPVPIKAICLGIGSFDPEDGSWQAQRRAHVQLAAFTTMVECMRTDGGHDIGCAFQEPCFTPADKAFLQELGHDVVDSPAGFEMVTKDSMLFGVHLYRDIYSLALENDLPAVFVGTGYDVWECCADIEAANWARMKELDQICEKVKFPDDGDFYPAFTSTSIHWRRPGEKRHDVLTH